MQVPNAFWAHPADNAIANPDLLRESGLFDKSMIARWSHSTTLAASRTADTPETNGASLVFALARPHLLL